MLNRWNFEIAKLISKVQSRYTLDGIQVHPDETIETDGYQLVRVSGTPIKADSFPEQDGFTPMDDFQPFIMGRGDALEVAKSIPTKSPLPVLNHAAISAGTNGHVEIACTDLQDWTVKRVDKIDGRYPDVDRVMPDEGAYTLQIELDLNILIPVLQQMRQFAKTRTAAPVALHFKDQNSAVLIKADNAGTEQTMTALVMPMNMR